MTHADSEIIDDGAMTEQRSILVAVDPPTALPDLTPVLALALGVSWKIDLVHAVPAQPQSTSGAIVPVRDQFERDRSALDAQPGVTEARIALAAQAEQLADGVVDVEAHVLVGPPVDVVLTSAQMLNSALIVVVGHRRQTEDRTLLGSFTSALLKVTDRPVLVLPAGAAGTQPGFVAAVDRLIELIDRDERPNELVGLREAATAQLQQPASEERSRHLGQRLVDALHRAETSHPNLTRAINDVSYHLSGMGI